MIPRTDEVVHETCPKPSQRRNGTAKLVQFLARAVLAKITLLAPPHAFDSLEQNLLNSLFIGVRELNANFVRHDPALLIEKSEAGEQFLSGRSCAGAQHPLAIAVVNQFWRRFQLPTLCAVV